VNDAAIGLNDPSRPEQVQICRSILVNQADENPDKLYYYNRILTAEPVDAASKYLLDPSGSFMVAQEYNFENDPDADITIVELGINDYYNDVIRVKKISFTLVISDGQPSLVIPAAEMQSAMDAYNSIPNAMKVENGGFYRKPSEYYFPSLQAYKDYLSSASANDARISSGSAGVFEDVVSFNNEIDELTADRLSVFIRVFCDIEVLFLGSISLGVIAKNYGDNMDPNVWTFVVQFAVDLLGLQYSAAVEWQVDFDARRYRHLEGEEFHRALEATSLDKAPVNTQMSISCVPDSSCETFVKFFEVSLLARVRP
jgi:hypothetical protein